MTYLNKIINMTEDFQRCSLSQKTGKNREDKMHTTIRDGIFKNIVVPFYDTQTVLLVSKQVIQFDKNNFIPVARRKAVWVTDVAEIVFKLLEANNIKTAFLKKRESNCLQEKRLIMFPTTFIVRRFSLGTYPIRNPYIEYGIEMTSPIVEMFFHTDSPNVGSAHFRKEPTHRRMQVQFLHDQSGKKIKDAVLHHPEYPDISDHKCFVSLSAFPPSRISLEQRILDMEILSKKIFEVLEAFFNSIGIKLTDVKIEFGYSHEGELLVGDLISLDSWRILIDGKNHGKKMLFEENLDIAEVMSRLEKVTEMIRGSGITDPKKIIPSL